MNWNQIPRGAVEVAAAQGDKDAQATLLIHQRLDRIDILVDKTIESLKVINDTLSQLKTKPIETK